MGKGRLGYGAPYMYAAHVLQVPRESRKVEMDCAKDCASGCEFCEKCDLPTFPDGARVKTDPLSGKEPDPNETVIQH